MLLSTCVLYEWQVQSVDISTAFLQGDWLGDVQNMDGSQRATSVDFPPDAWELLPAGFLPSWISDPVAVLLKAVYGLKDAPALWASTLYRFLGEIGWVPELLR